MVLMLHFNYYLNYNRIIFVIIIDAINLKKNILIEVKNPIRSQSKMFYERIKNRKENNPNKKEFNEDYGFHQIY